MLPIRSDGKCMTTTVAFFALRGTSLRRMELICVTGSVAEREITDF